MKTSVAVSLFALAALSSAQGPLAFKFTKGEVIRYRATMQIVRSNSFKGETSAIEANGTHTITAKVTSASPSRSTMSVSYSAASATAKATSLPAEARAKKGEIEKGTADMLKRSLEGMTRTQSVLASGKTTYTLPLGDGKSMTIEDGAFMMLMLPKTPPTPGMTWTAFVR